MSSINQRKRATIMPGPGPSDELLWAIGMDLSVIVVLRFRIFVKDVRVI